jgi:hypothetical protein
MSRPLQYEPSRKHDPNATTISPSAHHAPVSSDHRDPAPSALKSHPQRSFHQTRPFLHVSGRDTAACHPDPWQPCADPTFSVVPPRLVLKRRNRRAFFISQHPHQGRQEPSTPTAHMAMSVDVTVYRVDTGRGAEPPSFSAPLATNPGLPFLVCVILNSVRLLCADAQVHVTFG